MNSQQVREGILTEDEFEYKLLMRVRQLRHKKAARLFVDLDKEEISELGKVECLKAKSVSSTQPIGAVILDV